jgi:hypothetical protein
MTKPLLLDPQEIPPYGTASPRPTDQQQHQLQGHKVSKKKTFRVGFVTAGARGGDVNISFVPKTLVSVSHSQL